MPIGFTTNHETSGDTSVDFAMLRSEVLAACGFEAAFDGYGCETAPLNRIVGQLAALLIVRWAGYDESECEAIAAFDEETFTPGLPEALRLSAWNQPTMNHATAVVEALRTITARNGAGSAAARYVSRVAPLLAHVVERSRSTYERLYASVRRIDIVTAEGRALAARLVDDVLHAVMARRGKLVGEFATPEQVAALMLELADPQPGDKVYDPCFGFGQLLVGAAGRLGEAARTASPQVWTDIREAGIFGVEINPIAYAVGLCRVLLTDIDRPGLELTNALDGPPRNRAGDGFDCILAAPPWGGRIARTAAAQFPFPSRHSESLFLQHVMANLRPGGRAVVALPNGSLFRPGSERQVRKALLSDYSVDAVVSLPADTFAPWTSIPVNLVVFRRAEPLSAVRFISIPPKAWELVSDTRDDCNHIGANSDGQDLGIDGLNTRYGGGTGGHAGSDAKFSEGLGSEVGTAREVGRGFCGRSSFRMGSGNGSGSGVEGAADVGFGGRIGYEGGTRFGTGIEDVAGFERKAGLNVGYGGGTGAFYGLASSSWLFRSVADLSQRRDDVLANVLPRDIEIWDTTVDKIALRNYNLVVTRKPGSDTLDDELARFAALDSSVKIERLERVAEIYPGKPYSRRCTTGIPNADDVVAGLMRFGDVKNLVALVDTVGDSSNDIEAAGLFRPSMYLTDAGKVSVDAQEILRPLDIVVTTSGTVGKVAFLPVLPEISRTMGAELFSGATSGAYPKDSTLPIPLIVSDGVATLRVRRGVAPRYLTALLRSPTFQSWLSDHASKTPIPQLKVRILRRLRIPVPPVPLQEAVLDELPGHRGDAMAVLDRLLSGASNNPVRSWLETPLVARLASKSSDGNESDSFGTLVAAAKALHALVIRTEVQSDGARSEIDNRRIGAWLGVVRQVAMTLDGVASIPRGVGRLATLQIILSRLHEALRVLDGADGSVVGRLRSFTRAMVDLAEGEVRAMQESIRLDIALEPAEVPVGATSEVGLRVTNSSAVPLRSLHVSTRPPVGTGQLPYLADGETHTFPLAVHPHDAARPLRIAVSLRARRIDGAPVDREAELSLRVLSTREAVRSGDLGSSPYIVGSPVDVDREDMFFGRADIMERIKRQLGASTHANVVLLEGNRRTGKTSILQQLGRTDVLPGWIPVYCSFQGAEGHDSKVGITTREVFRLLAREIGRALYDAGSRPGFPVSRIAIPIGRSGQPSA